MRLRLVVALLLLIASPANASINADGDANGRTGGGEVTVRIRVEQPGSDGEATPAGSRKLLSPVRYEAVPASPFPSPDLAGLAHLCDPNGSDVIDLTHPGWLYHVFVYARSTGELVAQRDTCVALPDPNDTQHPPPPPAMPTPPTIGDAWDSADLPAPPIGLNPDSRGVCNLDTRFWTTAPEPVAVSARRDGYTITGTARPVGYRFASGDGAPVESSTPGSESDPAAHHLYDTKGTYRLRVETIWQADATLTGPDLPTPISIDLGTATVTAERDYQVVEIRSQLTG